MKIPYRWLLEFVETEATPQAVAERLTMAGVEVAGVDVAGGRLAGVRVGEILDVGPHPAGGSLTVCSVSIGSEQFRVVCGAPNTRRGGWCSV